MSKKKAAKKATKTTRRSALNNHTASIVDLRQFFSNPAKMENFMSQGKSQFDKFTNEANNIGRDGFEAFNKAMTILAKGCEDLVRTSVSIAQSTAEKQTQLIKEAMSSKSLNEYAEAHNRIAQISFDDCIAAVTKLSEMGVKVLTESAEPLNNQLTKGMKRASEAVAA